jgi:hypothetical protein
MGTSKKHLRLRRMVALSRTDSSVLHHPFCKNGMTQGVFCPGILNFELSTIKLTEKKKVLGEKKWNK